MYKFYYTNGYGVTSYIRKSTTSLWQIAWNPNIRKWLMRINLTCLMLLIAFMQVSLAANAQKISLSKKNAPLIEIFKELRRQSGYDFVINKDQIKIAKPVTIIVNSDDLINVLNKCFEDQPFTYSMEDKMIIVVNKTPEKVVLLFSKINVSGKIIDEKGEPLPGATIKVRGSKLITSSNALGEFSLKEVEEKSILEISYTGYISKEVIADKVQLVVTLVLDNSKLNEVQIIGYGQVTRKLNTGSVSSVNAEEINKQPVTNVISALSGRMAGVFVNTVNGLPGGGVNLQVRGKGSISAGTEPLYIIDEVPFPSTSLVFNTALGNGITGAISPLNSINPGDIESISVLKDADATAIYGSRGANGVVIITTKKGQSGKSRVNLEISKGFSNVSNFPNLLSLPDYLDIRREAFANAGRTPSSDPASPNYAPDLTVWDQNTSTDWAKYVMGNTAQLTRFYGAVSGGNTNTNFLISGNYQSETSVLLGKNRYQRGGTQVSIQHTSPNQKFTANASVVFTNDDNLQANPVRAFANQILLPPNFPLYDQLGNLNFVNTAATNPLAATLSTSEAGTNNIISNTSLKYEVLKGLNFKTNIGFNSLTLKQILITPKASLSPSEGGVSTTYFGDNSNQSIIVEPQLTYTKKIKNSRLDMLLGGSWQKSVKESESIFATNFSSESLLKNLSSAGTVSPLNSLIEYKYASVFGRITYNLKDRYILNGSIRRDGSSRFGPGNQFGTFGAIGGAWIVTREEWAQNLIDFLSYGKIRGSYGITGSDQITDYQYLSTYGSVAGTITYQGYSGLNPSRISNANFRWEENKKLEVGIETGFLNNKILLNVNFFNNISGNQLVNYALPAISGFATYQANLPAKIRNTGWEFEINTKNITNTSIRWETHFNLTVNRNRLLSFPNIETSSYNNLLRINESILRATGYILTGMDANGLPQFLLKNGESSITPAFENSFFTVGDRNPAFYGGLNNQIGFKGFELDVFTQFAKQVLAGGLTSPGDFANKYDIVASRWRTVGDNGLVPRPTLIANTTYRSSSANYFDASYIRIKNISLSYDLTEQTLKSLKLDKVRIYAQVQNLLTFWKRKSALYDPETGANVVPPLRTFNFGFQLNL